jgi:hypothetical protein
MTWTKKIYATNQHQNPCRLCRNHVYLWNPMLKKRFFAILGISIFLSLSVTWMGMQQTLSYDIGIQYEKLCTWDCLLYAEIAETGYHFTLPPLPHWHSNVSFFPTFPISARAVHLSTGLSGKDSVLIISQIFAVAFWLLFFLILESWNVDFFITGALTIGILAQPASFFLVTGYSESMFLSGLLAMIYFHQKRKPLASGISAFFMSASRIVGLPLAIYPLISKVCQAGLDPRKWKNPLRPVYASVIGAMGAGLFFFYCYLKWGFADLYMQNQKEGWGIVPDYFALFHWDRWNFATRYDFWSTYSIPVLIVAFALIEALAYFRFKDRRFNERLPIYFCILAMDYINISGLIVRWFYSMVRYVFPCVVLFSLCAAHLSKAFPKLPTAVSAVLFVLWTFMMGALFYNVELPHYIDYVRYIWFA